MRKVIITCLFAVLGYGAMAQGHKIGHINVEYVLAQLPEMKELQSDLEGYQAQIEAQIKQNVKELQELEKKLQDPNTPAVVKQNQQQQYQDKYKALEDMQRNAEFDLLNKQEKLMKPVLDKIQAQIDVVAKEKNLDYVLMSGIQGTNFILYAKSDNYNITKDVLKKLGVAVKEDTAKK